MGTGLSRGTLENSEICRFATNIASIDYIRQYSAGCRLQHTMTESSA